jgi:hypothetical protein
MSYRVAQFVTPKREDWDNGSEATERAALDAFRYERTRSPMMEIMQRLHNAQKGTP